MSLLSVLFGRSGTAAPAQPTAATPSRPHDAASGAALAKSAPAATTSVRSDGKTGVDAERADRRERLYRVVREALMRCGVLSASYKFKVLSTDARGLQFLVMLDVASDTAQLMRSTEVEGMIRQAAKDQYDIDVASLYWRVNPQLSPRAAQLQAAARREPVYQQPGPAYHTAAAVSTAAAHSNMHAAGFGLGQSLQPGAQQPVPMAARLNEAPQRPVPARPGAFGFGNGAAAASSRYDPIHSDEVNAFKQALASNNSQPAPADGILRRSGARQKPAVDFEDTQVFAANRGRGDLGLSATQYGDLQ